MFVYSGGGGGLEKREKNWFPVFYMSRLSIIEVLFLVP